MNRDDEMQTKCECSGHNRLQVNLWAECKLSATHTHTHSWRRMQMVRMEIAEVLLFPKTIGMTHWFAVIDLSLIIRCSGCQLFFCRTSKWKWTQRQTRLDNERHKLKWLKMIVWSQIVMRATLQAASKPKTLKSVV